jgi:glucosamine kinase
MKGALMAFLIAVDGGGTSCRAVIADERGAPLGEGLAGSANIVTDMEAARANIVEAVRLAAAQAGLPESAVAEGAAVLGLAGANIGDTPARIVALLPFRVSHVVTDARIALEGALGENDGAVAVVGTGSVFIARKAGRIRTVGGWGPVVGDFCSGARLGRTLLEETLLAHDGVRTKSRISANILAHYGNDPGALVEYAQAAKPRDFASFAPLLFEYADQGDDLACGILSDAVRHLELTLETLIGGEDLPFCLLGGLASSYAKRLSPTFKSRERQPDGNALNGALAMAVAMFGNARGGKQIHG